MYIHSYTQPISAFFLGLCLIQLSISISVSSCFVMEPAKIDWNNLEWRFVEDKAYEQISAPKWFDFLNPNDNLVDDNAFFCRSDCKHPRTAEDFLRSSPSKFPSPSTVSGVSPCGDKIQRDVKLKRRGLTHSSVHPTSSSRFKEDSENQNPNLSTPPNYQAKAMKEAIKSSSEKNQPTDITPLKGASEHSEVLPRLKSTLSARNLFVGKDILNQITDFCSELKRMASRAREREEVERSEVKKGIVDKKEEYNGEVLSELNGREKEIMPMVEVGKGKTEGVVNKQVYNSEMNGKKLERMPLLDVSKGIEGRTLKENQKIMKRADEDSPISVNLENVKRKMGEDLLQIRTNPPSPQCFSATRPASKITPLNASKSKLMENGGNNFQGQSKQVTKESSKQVNSNAGSTDKAKSVSIADGREPRTLDVFWFLKPCTLSTGSA